VPPTVLESRQLVPATAAAQGGFDGRAQLGEVAFSRRDRREELEQPLRQVDLRKSLIELRPAPGLEERGQHLQDHDRSSQAGAGAPECELALGVQDRPLGGREQVLDPSFEASPEQALRFPHPLGAPAAKPLPRLSEVSPQHLVGVRGLPRVDLHASSVHRAALQPLTVQDLLDS